MDKCTKTINEKKEKLENIYNIKNKNDDLIRNLINENKVHNIEIKKINKDKENLQERKKLIQKPKEKLKELRKKIIISLIFPSIILSMGIMPSVIAGVEIFKETLVISILATLDLVMTTVFVSIPLIERHRFKNILSNNTLGDIENHIKGKEIQIESKKSKKKRNEKKIVLLKMRQSELILQMEELKQEIMNFENIRSAEINKYLKEKNINISDEKTSDINKKYLKNK